MQITSLNNLFDINALPRLKNFKSYMASSRDPEGGNYDWGHYEQVIGTDGVAMDADGPGIITRLWSADPHGQIRIYLDGNPRPAVEEEFDAFLQKLPLRWGHGLLPGSPEFEEAARQGGPGGRTSYCPIPFRAGCRVVLSPAPQTYYHINYLLCSQPHGLPAFSPDQLKAGEETYQAILDALQWEAGLPPGSQRIAGSVNLVPGQKRVLLNQAGSLTVRSLRFKVTWPEDQRKSDYLKQNLHLRGYWDEDFIIEGLPGRRCPSIKSPLAAFFMDFGAFEDYESAMMFKQGGQYACRFPMPVRERAALELANDSCLETGDIEYEIAYEPSRWQPDTAHFRAVYHSENATWGHDLGNYRDKVMYLRNREGHQNYPVLRTWGQGHFVGCCFDVDLSETPFPRAAGEADEAVFVDDDPERTMWGTGNEDYINDAWGIHRALTPLAGGAPTERGFFGFRFHLSDCIPFDRKIAFTLEHGSSNNCTGLYRSVSYFYLKPSGPYIHLDAGIARRTGLYWSR